MLFAEGAVGPEVALPRMIDGGVAQEGRHQMPRGEVAAHAYRGVVHPERFEDLLLHELAVVAAPRVTAAQHLAHQRMIDHGRMGDLVIRGTCRIDVLADRGDHLVEVVQVHAGTR